MTLNTGVAAHTHLARDITDLTAANPGVVTSVNARIGDVVLAASDVGAQPVDSDLTAIAALATTSYGRALLVLADAAAGRTAFGLGTAATSASTDFQPVDSDLTAIAALTTTSFGRSILTQADSAALRTLAGLGTAAVLADPITTAHGGTGQTTAGAGFDALSPLSTRGDLLYRDATTNQRLAKGTSGQFLKIGASDPAWASITEADVASLGTDLGAKVARLANTAVKTAAYSAVVDDKVLVDSTSSAFDITLPTTPADKARVGVLVVGFTSAMNVKAGGSDVFNVSAGPTSYALGVVGQFVVCEYNSANAIWYVEDHLPLASADARYASSASTSGMAKSYGTLFGDGTNRSYTVTHNLNNAYPETRVTEVSTGYDVDVEVQKNVTANTVIVAFEATNAIPTTNQYHITAIG